MATMTTVPQTALGTTRLSPAKSRTASYARLPWLQAAEALMDGLTICCSVKIGLRVTALFEPSTRFLQTIVHLNVATLVFACVMVLLLDRCGAYDASGGLLRIRETACVIESVFIATLPLLPCLLLPHAAGWVFFVCIQALVLAALLALQKHLTSAIYYQIRRNSKDLHRVLIYGTRAAAQTLCLALERSPKLGFLPVALVYDSYLEEPIRQRPGRSAGEALSFHHPTTFSTALVEHHRAETVILASPIASQAALDKVIAQTNAAGARVIFGAEAHTVGPTEMDYIKLDGQIIYGVHQVKTYRLYEAASRMLDIFLSFFILLAMMIPMAIAAIAIALETEGPIFFKQVRIGRDGMPFTIYKFRTMHTALCRDDVSPADRSDPRITRAGKWLRRTSFDELPQLFNVLLGDMGLVGPRPEMAFIVDQYTERQRQRLSVKPGLTGIWQISADRRYPIHENLHYDLYYIKHRSLSMDLALLFHTLLFAVQGT